MKQEIPTEHFQSKQEPGFAGNSAEAPSGAADSAAPGQPTPSAQSSSERSPVSAGSISGRSSTRNTLRPSLAGKPENGVKCDPATSSVSPLKELFGTNNENACESLLRQVFFTVPEADINNRDAYSGLAVLPILRGLGPKDTIEGLLAVQMIGVHNLAMAFLARAVAEDQTFQEIDAHVNRANKLLRTLTAQLEALNRHRGKISSQMLVGNVNVNDGGQAIVGPVNHPGPGEVSKETNENRIIKPPQIEEVG